MTMASLDAQIIRFFHRITVPTSRFAIFVVYFWFGFLKVIGLSPANPLVRALFERTIPFANFTTFIILFGLFECLIGLSFLIVGLERAALPLMLVHLVLITLPLVLLPHVTWQSFLVPTLEGQYIIKDILIVATVISIVGHVRPVSVTRNLAAPVGNRRLDSQKKAS